MQVRIIGLPPDAEPSPVEHLMSFSHIDGDTVVYRYLGEKDSATRPEQGHAHDPSSFLLTCGACITDAREHFNRLEEAHSEFVNEILENAPESYDSDSAANAIVVEYVRDLEIFRDRTLNALDQMRRITLDVQKSLGALPANDMIRRFIDRFERDMRIKVRLDEPDAEHVHEDGSDCIPGCPAFDIARAWVTALTELTETGGWDARSDHNHVVLKRAAQKLLDKGVMYR